MRFGYVELVLDMEGNHQLNGEPNAGTVTFPLDLLFLAGVASAEAWH